MFDQTNSNNVLSTTSRADDQIYQNELTNSFLMVFNHFAAPVISLVGVVANIFNIIVYIKLGVGDPSNLSFLALALSDLCGLLIGVVFEILTNPMMLSIQDLTFDPTSVGYLTAAWPRALFSRTTCCITVFITVERCLCIASPLRVKSILTCSRTLMILIALFAACLLVNFINIYTGSLFLTYQFDPAKNRSTLGMGINDNYNEINLISGTANTASFMTLFAILITSTAVLMLELKKKTQWRKKLDSSQSSKFHELSKRDKSISVTIAVLAIVLTLTYLPFTAICVADIMLDGFYTHREFSNYYDVMFMISLTFECINSSASLLVYHKVSSQYRKTFKLLVSCTVLT